MSDHDDADLIERIRATLPRLPIPAASPAPSIARGRRRRHVAWVRTALVVVVLAAAVVVPVKLLSGMGADGPEGPAGQSPSAQGSSTWPTVVIGDPNDAYVDHGNPEIAKRSEHVLASGSVGGQEFSFLGYTRASQLRIPLGAASRPCIEIAGPAYYRLNAGVGGWCVLSLQEEMQAGWPAFPRGADVLLRHEVAGGSGVCRNCTRPVRQPVEMGFVTDRVARLDVSLEDGSIHHVPVLDWPNRWHYKSFVFFPPSSYEVGQLLAYDAEGRLLAKAPLCGPDTGTNHCDISPTEQIAPMPAGQR